MRGAWIAIIVAGCSQPARDRASRTDEPAASSTPVAEPRAASAIDAATADITPDATAVDAAAASRPAIVDAPMKWSPERERLTLEYRRRHSDADAPDLAIEPKVIVLHYTDGPSAAGTRSYFDNVKIEAARKDLAKAGAVNVSSHFVVDRDGTIYQLQPETRFARHCIGLNHIAIGIENVGDETRWPLTDAQVAADAALVRDLASRFPITHLLGHHEVMSFRDHPYYVERDPGYRNSKGDPGTKFMARVRALVADLKLSGPSS